jgi:hypothetical protein
VSGSLQLLDTFRDQVHARMTTGDEQGVSIVDADTRRYLDRQFDSVRDRVDRAVQRIGGTTNSIYNNRNQDFQNLVMPQEVATAAKAASDAAARALARLNRH